MFKLVGTVTGVFRDVKTGKITKELGPLNNHVQDWFLKSFHASTNTPPSLGRNLFISEYNPRTQTRSLSSTLSGFRSAQGAEIAGVEQTQLTYEDSPGVHLIQVTQRFSPPATDFTINTVGLCSSAANTTVSILTNIVWLETPCIQTTTESLDLFYRIQVLFNPEYLSNTQETRTLTPWEAWRVTGHLANINKGTHPLTRGSNSRITGLISSFANINFRKLNLLEPNRTTYQSTLIFEQNSMDIDTEFFKGSVEMFIELTESVGKIISQIGANTESLVYKITNSGNSPIQSIFGHKNTSVTPFYTAADSQLGLGNIFVNGDNWVKPNHPKYFKVNIVDSGIIGTSSYNLKAANSYGFDGNTFRELAAYLPWSKYANRPMHDNFEMLDANIYPTTAYVIPFFGTTVLACRSSSICQVDVLSGESITVNNTTLVGTDLSPRFLASAISQMLVTNSNNVFIGCRNTGLYKFNQNFTELTVINAATTGLENTAGCFGVVQGKNGRIWAYFNHSSAPGIYYSDDEGSSWLKTAFTTADLPVDSGPVINIYCDKNNDHLAISYFKESNQNFNDRIFWASFSWWNNETQTASDGVSFFYYKIESVSYKAGWQFSVGETYGFQGLLSCSPVNSVWLFSGDSNAATTSIKKIAFGSSVEADLGSNLNSRINQYSWVQTENGTEYLWYISDSGEGGTQTDSGFYSILIDPVTENYEAFKLDSVVSRSNFWFLLEDNVWFLNEAFFNSGATSNGENWGLCTIAPYLADEALYPVHHELAYPTYGWDGTNWVKNTTTPKPTHLLPEPIIDGITVAFSDNNGNAPFFDVDYYTFGVVDGIWLDGFTTFTSYWELYSKPTILNTEIESPTLPVNKKVPNILKRTETNNPAFYTDLESTSVQSDGDLHGTGNALIDDYNAGARSLNPVIDGTISPFIPFAVPVPGTDIKNAQGYVTAAVSLQNLSSSGVTQYYFGLSSSDRLTTPLDPNTIKYAIHINNQTPEALALGDTRYMSFKIVENGIERYVYPDALFLTSLIYFRIVLLNNGSMAYFAYIGTNWILLYQSPPGSVTVESLHLDVCYVPRRGEGLEDISYHSLDSTVTDYYMYLGNGLDQGVYHPEFVAIDPESVKLKINGNDAIMIGRDDTSTVLAANSYSVYPYAGVIRFSAADAGLPVEAEYVTIVNE